MINFQVEKSMFRGDFNTHNVTVSKENVQNQNLLLFSHGFDL